MGGFGYWDISKKDTSRDSECLLLGNCMFCYPVKRLRRVNWRMRGHKEQRGTILVRALMPSLPQAYWADGWRCKRESYRRATHCQSPDARHSE
jgi:hypothetical protein